MGKCVWAVRPEDRLCKYCKLTLCEDRDYTNSRKYGTVAPTMRKMEVGDKAVFGIDKYNAVRTCMSRQKPRRFSMFMQDLSLHVERIS